LLVIGFLLADSIRHPLASSNSARDCTRCIARTTSNLGRLASRCNPLVCAAHVGRGRLSVGLNIGKGSGITPVGVDACTFRTGFQADIINRDVSLVALGAVTARSVELPNVLAKKSLITTLPAPLC